MKYKHKKWICTFIIVSAGSFSYLLLGWKLFSGLCLLFVLNDLFQLRIIYKEMQEIEEMK